MKKKTLQKLFAMTLAGVMAIGTLSACGKSNPVTNDTVTSELTDTPNQVGDTEQPDNTIAGIKGWEAFKENVTITVPVYDRGKEGYPAVDNNYWTKWIQSEFGDKYNITVNYVPIPRGDVMTKYSMLIAAKDSPTIMMEYDYPKVTQWANDGAMTTIDLDEFKQVAPTYYQKMVDNDQLGYTGINGETFFVLSERPYYNTSYNSVNFVRMDWLRAVGYDKVPDNYKDYSEAINKIIEAGLTDMPPINFSLPSAAYVRNFAFREFPVDEKEWVMHSSLGTPSFSWEPTYRMLKKFNQEYHAGWYSKEFELDLESTSGSQAETDFINGKLFEYGGYMSSSVSWLSAFYEKNPDAELAIKPSYSTVDGELELEAALRANNPFGMIIGFSSTATDEELKAAWMLMEWMIQPDILFTLENGVEGVNFTYDENGIAQQINLEGTGNEMMLNHSSNIDMTCLVHATKTIGESIEDAIKAIVPLGLPQDFTQGMIDSYYEKAEIANSGKAYSDPIFAVTIDSESEYSASLLSMYQEYFAILVKSKPEEFDGLYNKYKEEFLNAGYQEIMDERLEAYENGQCTTLPELSK